MSQSISLANKTTSGVRLAEHTTFHLGGVAEYFFEAHTEEQLRDIFSCARTAGVEVRILGGGSNILAADHTIAGVVVKNNLKGFEVVEEDDRVFVTVAAGEVLDEIVARTVGEGWWGMENLSSIPGSVGAVPIQNVGAYGVECAHICVAVRAMSMIDGEIRDFSLAECQFGYRDSFFKSEAGRSWCVIAVTFQLSKNPQPQISYKDLAAVFVEEAPASSLAVREVIQNIRAKKFPDWSVIGTAGSFFKNPIISHELFTTLSARYTDLAGFQLSDGRVKVPLGWILDNVLHIRGQYDGLVGSYEGQALVLVAKKGATTDDVEAFAQKITAEIYEKMTIEIEWEVTQWK